MESGEIDLATLPIFALFNPALGITTVIPKMNPRKPALAKAEELVDAIQKFGVTSAFASPVIGKKIRDWCEQKKILLPSMKRIFLAGAPPGPELVEGLSKILTEGEVYIPYGATEALPVAFCMSKDIVLNRKSIEHGAGSLLGSPINGVTLSTFPVSNGPFSFDVKELGRGEIGEICVSGDIVTDGYYQMPGASFDARFEYKGRVFTGWATWATSTIQINCGFLEEKPNKSSPKMVLLKPKESSLSLILWTELDDRLSLALGLAR